MLFQYQHNTLIIIVTYLHQPQFFTNLFTRYKTGEEWEKEVEREKILISSEYVLIWNHKPKHHSWYESQRSYETQAHCCRQWNQEITETMAQQTTWWWKQGIINKKQLQMPHCFSHFTSSWRARFSSSRRARLSSSRRARFTSSRRARLSSSRRALFTSSRRVNFTSSRCVCFIYGAGDMCQIPGNLHSFQKWMG